MEVRLIRKLKPLIVDDIEGEKAILEVLEHISGIEDKMVPKCYLEFLYEVTKNTPVVGLIQSQSRISLASIKSFLDKQVDIYEDKDKSDIRYIKVFR